jgi:hypothetical protein
MTYRTKTYIAADWTGDNTAVEQLYRWKKSEYWGLDFHDAHEDKQSSDNSLNCSIKASLRDRLDISKTFVLIVGEKTKTVRSGECSYCFKNYECGNTSNKSFIEYECDKAIRDKINIIVLYNATSVDKSKCPEAVKNIGIHTPMKHIVNGVDEWNYQAVKTALEQ